MTTTGTHLFWAMSRAAGTTAMVFASLTVGLGLMMSVRMFKGWLRDRRVLHEVLSLSVLVAIAVHALALLGDSYLRPTVLDLTLPFASAYRTGWTSLGITAGWGLAVLGLAYYVRGRIGVARFKQIHRFTLLGWAGALLHSFGEGSDAGKTWFVALIVLSCLPALLALAIKFGPRLATLINLSTGPYDRLTPSPDA